MKKLLLFLILASGFSLGQSITKPLPTMHEIKLLLNAKSEYVNIDQEDYNLFASVTDNTVKTYTYQFAEKDAANSLMLERPYKKNLELDFNLAGFAHDKKKEKKSNYNIYYFAGAVVAAVIVYSIWPEKEHTPVTKKTFGTPKTP